jgi:hypothetical protein
MIKSLAKKSRIIRFLKERLLLRFHMSLILIGTFLAGLLVSKLLLVLHVNSMLVRYPIAVLFSYISFFVFVHIWLWYVRKNARTDLADAIDLVSAPDVSGSGGETISDTGIEFDGGGGGQFGGGGASGSFSFPQASVSESAGISSAAGNRIVESAAEITDGTSSAMEEGSSAAGEAAGSALEEGGLILVVLGFILAVVFGAGIYLIYEAPMILSEAAFDFLLASSLIRGARKLDRPDWMSGVFKTTWIPFAVILLLSLLFASVAYNYCPQAAKLSEVLKHCISSNN